MPSIFLTGDTKLGWRTDDENEGCPKIVTWEAMRGELRDQFLPTNTAWVARDAFKKLRQTGTMREYIKQFSSYLLDIKGMLECDKHYNFVTGLQPCVRMELKWQKV